MFGDLKYVTKFYLGSFEKVFLLSITILLPILLLHSYIVNIVYMLVYDPITEAASNFYYSLISFQTLIFSLSPFVLLLKEEYYVGEIKYKKIFADFIICAFQMFAYSVLFSILVALGLFFFVLPGIVICILFIGVPFTALIQNKSVWKSIRTAIKFGKQNFFKLLFILLVVSLFEIILGFISEFLVYKITTVVLAQILVQMFINLLIFPLLAMWLAKFFIRWLEK